MRAATEGVTRPRRRARAAARLCRAASLLASVALLASTGWVGEAGAGEEETPPAPVELESLFRLPRDSQPSARPRAGGVSRKRWEERFRSARADLRRAEERVTETQRELESLASNSESWQIAAPGAQQQGAENSPLSYKLRQELRGHREEVERAERRLRELETEASLAGVPEAWRRPPAPGEDAVPGGDGS